MNLLIVELKRNELVFAAFRKKRGELSFIEARRLPLGSEDPFTDILEGFATAAAAERRVILAIPSNLLFMREMELPITDRRKVRELLPLELKGETAVDTDELVFEALPLDEGKVLALWAKRRDLADRIRQMAEKGLEPEIVTASLCNWQAILPPEAAETTVAVTDGESLAIYRNGTPLYFRVLGGSDADAEVTKTLAALEIGKGIVVEKIFSHGGRSRSPVDMSDGSAQRTSAFPPIPVNGALAETFAGDMDAARDLAGAYAVARSVGAGELVNLRSGELAYTAGRDRARKKLRLSLILAAAIVILLSAEVGLRYYLVKKDVDSLNNSILGIYKGVFPARKKPVDEVAELRAEIKRLSSSRTTSNTLSVLKKLAEAKGDEVSGIFEVEIDGTQVRLKGDARSFQAVNDFKSRTAANFSNGEVGEIKSRPDGTVSFVFRGSMKEGNK